MKKIRIIPLGGLSEIGKNLTLIECGKDIIAVDCGMAFPDEDMPGVDYVIPDMQYILKNKDRFSALIITHGHEDHIGAIPYLLKDVDVPVYGTKMSLGIIYNKLKEFGLEDDTDLCEVNAGDVIDFDSMSVEFIHVNHSIADAVALAIHTPCGVVLYMSDFKIDVTPVDGDMIDLARIGALGNEGILALLMDSTNVERPGFASSELTVRNSLDNIFMRHKEKRIIVATFASNVHRVQTVIDLAALYGRKVAISGRSMLTVIEVAIELGYMNVPSGTIVDIEKINSYSPDKVVIVTTGSQGEAMSALYRMAYSDHKVVEINSNDLVIMSSNAIPGNEKFVSRVVDALFRSGAEVVYDNTASVHVSGHACQEELKLIFGLTHPKFFIPVHGEYRHLVRHSLLAQGAGVKENNIVIADNGDIIELDRDSISVVGTVPSGRVFVDGHGVGDVGNIVLRDRKLLSQEGMIIISGAVDYDTGTYLAGPEVISRGFVYMKDNPEIFTDICDIALETVSATQSEKIEKWEYDAKTCIKDDVAKYIYSKTKRKPMIIPLINIVDRKEIVTDD